MRICRVSFEELLDLQDSVLGEQVAARLRSHIDDGCRKCEGRLVEISRIRSVMQMGELVPAPDHVVARACSLFRERYSRPARRSLLAELVFDSRSQIAIAGARGVEVEPIQALYRTGEHDIDLWHERGADGLWYVIGQVLPTVSDAVFVPEEAMLTSSEGQRLTATRQDNELHWTALPAGDYTLSILAADAEITAEVVIGAS